MRKFCISTFIRYMYMLCIDMYIFGSFADLSTLSALHFQPRKLQEEARERKRKADEERRKAEEDALHRLRGCQTRVVL